MNNIFFGTDAYFQINNIALDAAQKNYVLTFGTEKYSQAYGSLFTNSEFHVYVSKNGNDWVELEYTYAGTAEGRWNVATAEFTLNEVPENLFIKFEADVASSYRIDDVQLLSGNGGQNITFPGEKKAIIDVITAVDGTKVTIEDATVIGAYARGILVEDTTGKLLVYTGSIVDATIGDVVTVRGDMATYAGLRQLSGDVEITKTGTTTYTFPATTTMNGFTMDNYLADPVIEYVKYTGTLNISGYYYNVVLEGASKAVGSLSYPIEGTVDTSLDGEKIVVTGWTIGFTGGKYVNTMITSVTKAEESNAIKVTVAEFLAAAEDDTIYELTGEVTSVTDTLWGNFYIKDTTGEVFIYGLNSPDDVKQYWEASGVKVGDTITIHTIRTSYNSIPQGKNATYVSHVPAEDYTSYEL